MIRVFGPTGIDGRGQLAGRDRQVLATLVVSGGRDCPADHLAAAVYGDAPPATWRKVVQGSIVHLRRALGPRAIETTVDGYRLAVGDEEVDIRRFERLVERARDLQAAGEPERAVVTLREALELARGDPLCELDGWEPGRAEAAHLQELRLLAQDRLVEGLLALGQHLEAVTAAAAFVEQEPLREQRWAALALAQYRAGRQGDALRSITRARRVLADELGIDPGTELVELERAVLAQDPALSPAAVGPVPVSDVCPYRGLAGYDVSDADYFFGRERAVQECLARLASTGFVAVVGPSGCGKSSLACAGVAPALEREDRGVAVLTPGPRPAEALASTPRAAALVVDQLEELFTQCADAAERAQFVEALEARAARVPVVVALRSDHLAEIAELPALAARVESGVYLLRPMVADDFRAAIEGPARRAGLRLEPGLVELLVRDVTDQPGALPLLSHALTETWARREGRVLTTSAYGAVGGVHGAVSQTAERAMEGLPPEGRRIARELFLRLVSITGGAAVRLRLAREDLVVDVRHAEVLDSLASARLVTVDGATVQVAHEALAVAWPRLQTWLDEDREGQRILQHLSSSAAGWAVLDRDESELYRGGRLRSTEDWVASNQPTLTATERAFLDASIAARQAVDDDIAARAREQLRVHRRLRRSFVAICVALVGALLAAGLALVQGSRASDQRDRARASSRELALTSVIARSEALRATKRDLAALLAVAAYRSDPRAETFGAVLGAFTAAPSYLRTIPLEGTAKAGQILPDGTTYAVTDEHLGVRLIDLASGTEVAALPPLSNEPTSATYFPIRFPPPAMSLSPDGRHLALATSDPSRPNLLTMWDLTTRERRFPDVTLPFRPGSVTFSPDGRLIAVSGGGNGDALVRAVADGSAVQTIPGIPGVTARQFTAAVAFLPDGSLAVTSQAGPLRIVNPLSGEEIRRLDGPEDTAVISIALAPDGHRLFGSSIRGMVAWDLVTGRLLWHRPATQACGSLAVADIIGALLCGRSSGRVDALDVKTGGKLDQSFDYQYGQVLDLTVADGGRLLIEVGGRALALWRLDGGGPVSRVVPLGSDRIPWEFDPRGHLLVAQLNPSGPPLQPTLVDPRTGKVVDDLDGIVAATLVPARPGWLAALFSDGTGGYYDTDAHQRVPGISLRLPFIPTTGAAPTHDGLAFSDDDQLQAVDLSGRLVPPAFRAPIARVVSSVAGNRLFTFEPSGLVPRSLTTGEPTGEAPLEAQTAVAAADVLVVARGDGRVQVLDAETLKVSGPDPPPVAGPINSLALSQDGRRLIVAGVDRTAQLVDLTSRTLLGSPIDLGPNPVGGRGAINAASGALSGDGELMAVQTSRGVAVWDLDPEHLLAAACAVAGRNLTEIEWRQHLAPLGPYRDVCPNTT